MKVVLMAGEMVQIELEDSDGTFTISYDVGQNSVLSVHADLPDSDGRVGIIYAEYFGRQPLAPKMAPSQNTTDRDQDQD